MMDCMYYSLCLLEGCLYCLELLKNFSYLKYLLKKIIMKFCIPVFLFLVRFKAQIRTDYHYCYFMAYCTLGHGPKYRVCMFSTFSIKVFFVSKRVPCSKSGKTRQCRFSSHRTSHKRHDY